MEEPVETPAPQSPRAPETREEAPQAAPKPLDVELYDNTPADAVATPPHLNTGGFESARARLREERERRAAQTADRAGGNAAAAQNTRGSPASRAGAA